MELPLLVGGLPVYGAALRLTFSEIDLRKWVENRKRKADAKRAELEATIAGVFAQIIKT